MYLCRQFDITDIALCIVEISHFDSPSGIIFSLRDNIFPQCCALRENIISQGKYNSLGDVKCYISPLRRQYLYNMVWLSLIWDTDWLNTITWSTNISVCCPPQSCGGGTLIDTTHFSRKQMANWACDTIASNMYVDRPSRALAFYCAHSTMDTRCTAAHSTMDTHCTAHNLRKSPLKEILSL